MNHNYSIIFNASLGQYQVVSEKTKTRRSKARKLTALVMFGLLMASSLAVTIDDTSVVNVSDITGSTWGDYQFTTTNTPDRFGFATWNDPNSQLINNINDYFNDEAGYLNVDTNVNFTIGNNSTTNINGLVAINVTNESELFYTLDNPNNSSQLFNIGRAGTLILNTEEGSSIHISGFTSEDNGGAIFNSGYAYLGHGVKFSNNKIDVDINYLGSGGAIYNDRTGILIIGDDAEFSHNTAANGGGIETDGVVSIGNGAIFNNNQAEYGGGIDIVGSVSIGNDAQFISNNATLNAGAIFVYNNAKLTINDGARFINNSAEEEGGAITIADSAVMKLGNDAHFIENKLIGNMSSGGAINSVGDVILGDGAQFIDNAVTADVLGYGGAIYIRDGSLELGEKAQFINNSVQSGFMAGGGAIYAGGHLIIGSGATFQGNSVSAGQAFGGAIINFGDIDILLGNPDDITVFSGNLANGESSSIGIFGGSLNISGDGTLDMLDPFFGSHPQAAPSTITQIGTGTWKLGGMNDADQTALNIESGTLQLYADNEAENASRRVEAGSLKINTMTLGTANNGATLVANGGNIISGNTLTLHSGSTFGFHISEENIVGANGAPVMTWDFSTITVNPESNFTVNIVGDVQENNQYHLLTSLQAEHGLEASALTHQISLNYFGYDVNTINRVKDHFALDVDSHNIYLNAQEIARGTSTWNNTDASAEWNVADENWNVAITGANPETTFASGDEVIFGDLGLAEQNIHINAAGSVFSVNGMTVDSSTHYTFNGDGLALQEGTELIKDGEGTLAFNNRVTGNVDLIGGQLIIGDSLEHNNAYLEGTVTAKAGTTVGGHGTIAGVVNIGNNATLSPGNSIGTITLGELNMQDGSRVALDIMPTGEIDKISVRQLSTATGTTSGNVNIGQNVYIDLIAGAGQWSPTTYSFMTAEGTITGKFAGVNSNLAFLTAWLHDDTKGFTLEFTRNDVPFANFATTYNQRSVANAIEFMPQDHAVYNAVIGMSGEQARLAYDNLSGELYASTENVLFHNAAKLQDGMLSRIHEGTDGLWMDGWGHNSHINGDGNAAKVENKGAGLLLGYDFNINQNILVGAAIGFEDSKIKLKDHNRQGENKVKSTHFMVYGNADLDVIEVKAGLSYSALRFKANRYVNIPTLAGNLHSKYRGHQVHAFIEGSKTFSISENYDVAPYLNLAYTSIKTKGFTENGSAAALSSRGQSNNRTSLTIGVKNDWYFNTERNLGITADIGWKHTFGNKTIDKRFNFVNTNTSFNIKSASINKNSALLGLGLKAKYKDLTIDVGYQGEFNSKVKDHAFGVKVKWSF